MDSSRHPCPNNIKSDKATSDIVREEGPLYLRRSSTSSPMKVHSGGEVREYPE